MTHNRFFNHCLICALILIVGFSFALVLPRLASSQGLAAHSEVIAQDNVPEATRYYVAKTGSGSPGTSWVNAFKNVQDALGAASSGDEIWVAAGIYYPDIGVGQVDNERTSTFELKEDVALYGGFDTGDKKFSDRDWRVNLTVLSGDIDGNDTHTEGVVLTTTHIAGNNAYHVVTADGATGMLITGSTILDGFTITAGQANANFAPNNTGGGFYCDGHGNGKECSPSLNNMAFSGNYAEYGGAMFNYGRNGDSSPVLKQVTFSGNSAEKSGGAMFNSGTFGTSSPSLRNVTFSGNSAYVGGAMYNIGIDGTSSPSLREVTFSDNSAWYGGAMFNNGSDMGSCIPDLSDVIFSGNSAMGNGGAIYNNGYKGNSSPILINVTFSGNSADLSGGAMYNDGHQGTSKPKLNDVTFSDNSAGNDGGAMYNHGEQGTSKPSLEDVTFSGNSAGNNGGAMYNNGSNGYSSPSLTNVVFSGNTAVFRGGAMYTNGSESGNSNPSLTNVTFSGNFAGEIGGGMYNYGFDGNSKPVVRNSILWNNQDNSGTEPLFGNIYNNAATVTVTHSIIQGSEGSISWTGGSYIDGGGNIDEDPLFILAIDPSTAPTTTGNLRLKTGSPAIDAGDNTYIAGFPTDLDGKARIVDGDFDGTPTVDMGAYEFGDEIYIPLIFR